VSLFEDYTKSAIEKLNGLSIIIFLHPV